MNHRGHRGSGGFTRGEMLVVISILTVSSAFLFSWCQAGLQKARMVDVINRGRQIHVSLFAPTHDSPMWNEPSSWPSTTSVVSSIYKSSSEFFAIEVKEGLLDVSFDFFAPPGSNVKAARNEKEFLDGRLHNMWCITLDVDDLRPKTPSGPSGPDAALLFTQNFKFKHGEPGTTLDHIDGLEPSARPWGDKYGVAIMRSGAGLIFHADMAKLMTFNPARATNGFLWPLSSGRICRGGEGRRAQHEFEISDYKFQITHHRLQI